jgi:S-adenosylmethionine:tRNA ribosyltransferase-isomerase
VRVDDFDFTLPAALIAQRPPAERGASRLLVLPRQDGPPAHTAFARLPQLLDAGDLLVTNDSRVYPARLLGHRVPSGGAVECLLLERTPGSLSSSPGAEDRDALVHPGQKLRPGSRVLFERDGRRLHGEVLARHFQGRRTIRLWTDDGRDVAGAVEAIGHIPLPPYITRADEPLDRDRYQTVYAREPGSIAAPTAGLHFTPLVLDELRARGVEETSITLHVGYGTFKPVRVDRVEDHEVDPETFTVSPASATVLTRALRSRRRIVAVGTTTTRALESIPVDETGSVAPGTVTTRLFIHPGHSFRIVQGLVTNFHLPRSSLLMLVSAFAGRERVLAAYREAVERGYRFYSYGDAMLIL